MELLAVAKLIKIYWLSDVRACYGVWSGFPNLAGVSEALRLSEDCTDQQGSTLWISSTQKAIAPAPDAKRFCEDWLKRMSEQRKLTHWADIPPESPTARMSLRDLGAYSLIHDIKFAQFNTLPDAKEWMLAQTQPALGAIAVSR